MVKARILESLHAGQIAKLSVLTLFALVLAWTPGMYAQGTAGYSLLLQPSPKSTGMGGCYAALSGTGFDQFGNVAGMAWCPSLDVAISGHNYRPEFGDNYQSVATIDCGIDAKTQIGVAFTGTNKGNYLRTTESGQVLGRVTLYDSYVDLSAARTLDDGMSVGLSLGYYDNSLFPATGNSNALDASNLSASIGWMMRGLLPQATLLRSNSKSQDTSSDGKDLDQGLCVGISIRNLGPKLNFSSFSYSQPLLIRAGALYTAIKTRRFNAHASVDLESQPVNAKALENIRVGIDLQLLNILSLRCGYLASLNTNAVSVFSYGAAAEYAFVRIQYSFYKQSFHTSGQFCLATYWTF